MRYRIIIAGSRGFYDYELLRRKMDRLTSRLEPSEILVVSGAARGADTLGEQWAEERGFPVRQFPAEWDRLGKAAGYHRNETMACFATHLVAFWDGKSRGTAHMIRTARVFGLAVRVVRFVPAAPDTH